MDMCVYCVCGEGEREHTDAYAEFLVAVNCILLFLFRLFLFSTLRTLSVQVQLRVRLYVSVMSGVSSFTHIKVSIMPFRFLKCTFMYGQVEIYSCSPAFISPLPHRLST